jgi:glucose/mannose transport system substrate-binding protein
MRLFSATILGAVALGAFAGPAAAQRAEVIHWWTSGGESASIQVFADMYEQAGGEWVDTAIAIGENARAAGTNRIVGGDPPTAMQFNTGKQFDDLVAQGLLFDLEAVATAGKWRDFLPQTLVDATNREGKFYAVPINVHGENWLFYNKPLFEELGAPAPDSWENFFAAADKLKAAGKVPLALGGQPWQERLTFNNVLTSIGGGEIMVKAYGEQDIEAIRSDTFRQAADTFAKLRDYVDEGSPGRNWNDATSMVLTGQAGMQFMGDWAKGEFVAAGKTADVDYGCIPGGPGESVFQIGGDVFVFPKQPDADGLTEAQVKLAELMISPEGQVAFNNKKGSVPVRADVDTSKMDACAQKGLQVMADASRQVPGWNFLMHPDLAGAIQDVVSEFWNTPSMTTDEFIDKVVEAVEAAG